MGLCIIPSPGLVPKMISTENYHACWPPIPRTDLDASSVDFIYNDDDGLEIYANVFMDKKYLVGSALKGKDPVQVCSVCHDPCWVKAPTLSMLIDLC